MVPQVLTAKRVKKELLVQMPLTELTAQTAPKVRKVLLEPTVTLVARDRKVHQVSTALTVSQALTAKTVPTALTVLKDKKATLGTKGAAAGPFVFKGDVANFAALPTTNNSSRRHLGNLRQQQSLRMGRHSIRASRLVCHRQR